MPFNEVLTERIRRKMLHQAGVVERKMFGGIAFLLNGNMCVGVWKDSLIARLGPEQAEEALVAYPKVGDFAIAGTAMTGWVLIGPDGIADDGQLANWIGRSLKFVRSLPAK